MAYELNGRENICIFGNVTTLQIILRNEILYSCFRFCFRHIRTYSSIVQEHTYAYSEPWHIPITKHIQTPRTTILFIILHVFTKTWKTNWGIFPHIRVYFSRFRHIQNPGTVRHIHVYKNIFRTHSFFRHIQNHRQYLVCFRQVIHVLL